MGSLNQLKRVSQRAYRRVGRGQSSTRGKTSGRGGKGQTARAGNKRRPELRDIIKKLPKNRGYQFNSVRKPVIVKREKALSKDGKNVETFSILRKTLGIKGGKIKIK